MFARALILSGLAAMAAAQSAVLSFTRVPNPITDGEPQAILYATNDTQSPVTILLRQGPASNLQTIETLTRDASGGQFIWTPPKSLPNGNDYALEIRQGNQNNYFGPFTVQGASPAAVSSASAGSMSSSVTGSMTTMATGNATMTHGGNMTMTGYPSTGTGTTMSRNTTMSSPTLSNTRTSATGGSTATTGAGFQGTETGASEQPTSTGNGAPQDFGGKSTVAFVLGAVAAVLALH